MTRREAQEILLSCRPGREPANDPQVAQALALTQTDPELKEWYAQHAAWDAAVRKKLASIPVPVDLKASILAERNNIVPGPAHWWQRRPALIAAAAAIVLLAVVGVMLLNPPKTPDTFATFRKGMIGIALREYRMDLQTNNMQAIREFLNRRGAPADYDVPPGVDKLKLAGCAALDWQGKKVSMVCFERTEINLVWMFVMQGSNWKDRPSSQAEFAKVITCSSASWSEGDRIYVVAGETDEATLRKLL